MARRRIVLITNPMSREGVAAATRAVRYLAREGLSGEMHVSEYRGHGRLLAAEAAREAETTVVAVGGDGTIGEVARGVLDAGATAPLGIIPAGTGNDTAKAFGLPFSVRKAVAIIVAGRRRRVDIAEVNDVPFVGLGVMGLAARVGEAVNRWKSGPLRPSVRLLGQKVYHVASMYYLLHGPRSLRARGLCDELETDGIYSAIVAVSHSGIRGVFRPCPAARNTDGKIDLCLFGARHPTGRRLTPREVLRTAWGTITGRHVEEPWVTAFQSRGEVLIHLTEPHSFQGDGDTLCEGCDFALRPLPSALEVIL